MLEFEKVRDFLFFRGVTLQAIWLYGQRPAISFLETFRGLIPFNKILLDTIDLEFRRAKQLNQPDESRRLKDELCALIEFCDTTIFISENEAQMCLDDLEIRPILKSAIVLSNVYPDMSCHNQDKIDLSERIYDGIFVGSYLHYPNQQAIKWLIQSILPRVEVGQFIIVGEGLPWEIVKMIDTLNSQADSVHVDYLGHVPNLDLVYSDTKFALAPLLSGAGVKGKVIEALHHGLPVIGTQIAFEGIGEHDGEILFQGEDEESFAEQVNELISLGRKGELFIDLNQVAPYLEKFSEKTATWKIVKLVDE
jgi:glycosyltransferase involved in cell wall biosynthesis